jgi:hypothetical protein
MYRGRLGHFFFVQSREEGETFPKGGFAINFCPFCGKNLREWFQSQPEPPGPAEASQ